jgi:predicted TIM-barrel fold metal-dependent hydrolase
MGDYVVVDTHHHFLPSEAIRYAKKTEDGDYVFILKRFSKASRLLQDIEKTLAYMEECRINMALLSMGAWIPNGLETCRAINDGYAKIQKEYPNKFIACAHLPVHEGSVVIDELKRSMEVLGLQGVALISSYAHMTIDSKEMMPFYEKISTYQVPIVVHPTLRRPLWGGVKYDLSTTISREYDIAKCVTEILYGVLSRYPDLKFLVSHFGGGMPFLKWRLLSSHQPEEWNLPEGVKGHGLTPRELKQRGLWEDFHLKFDKIYYDSAGFGGSMVAMRTAVEGIRRDRITFGTDYPYEFREPMDVRGYIADVKSLEIPEDDKKKILGQNVLDLFKIG